MDGVWVQWCESESKSQSATTLFLVLSIKARMNEVKAALRNSLLASLAVFGFPLRDSLIIVTSDHSVLFHRP